MDIRAEIKNFFGEGGLLAQKFTNYEYRKSQEDMALGVLDTLEGKTHMFIEAPTGVGKSFAYLVPAIYYAKKHKKKAIISTHTINLQEQLIHKDIPLLKELLPVEFKASLFKGKSNYVCPKRLRKAADKANSLFESEERTCLENIYEWEKTTQDGTTSDINFPVINTVWSTVCAEMGICSSKTCGGANTECYYQKAKFELADSDVIVVNHHLFFTLFDGVREEDSEGYLYPNDFIVFDEAHTLEGVAAEHIYPRLSREMIRYQLLRLYNERKKKGFLLTYPSLHILPIVQNLLELNMWFFKELRYKLFNMNSGRLERLAVRVYEKHIIEDRLSSEIDELIKALKGLKQSAKDEWDENELQDFITKFTAFKSILKNFLAQSAMGEGSNFVYWVELSSEREDSNVSLCSSSLDISAYFKRHIFRENNSAVLTSATLTINNNFKYFKRRLGGENTLELKLPSQFDFYRQVKIYIPRRMPAPSKDNDYMYRSMLRDWIYHFVKMTSGKALVLFTNSYLMRNIGGELKDALTEDNIDLLIQGSGSSRKYLLDEFKANINSVLLGLDSFWLGVDVPGEALSNLIITKLPFMVPDHPLVKARMEFIDERGGNSFMEYSLPEAILKFRQGVGRLIRSKNDTGIIAILDNRIISKPYGKYFLSSIDECEVEIVDDN
jgi:ATP-dependent DNA helicase DinG